MNITNCRYICRGTSSTSLFSLYRIWRTLFFRIRYWINHLFSKFISKLVSKVLNIWITNCTYWAEQSMIQSAVKSWNFSVFHATFSLGNEEIIQFAKIEFDMLIMIQAIMLICIVHKWWFLSKSHLNLRTLAVVLLLWKSIHVRSIFIKYWDWLKSHWHERPLTFS